MFPTPCNGVFQRTVFFRSLNKLRVTSKQNSPHFKTRFDNAFSMFTEAWLSGCGWHRCEFSRKLKTMKFSLHTRWSFINMAIFWKLDALLLIHQLKVDGSFYKSFPFNCLHVKLHEKAKLTPNYMLAEKTKSYLHLYCLVLLRKR